MPSRTILLLSGGGHTGRNVLAALAGRRPALRLVATGDDAAEPTLFGFDAVYLAPTLGDDLPAFERRFLEILARETPDLVIPCRDEDAAWLARFGQRHGDLAPRLLCGSPEVAEMAQDKWLSHQFALRHGLPFVPTFECGPAGGGEAALEAFVHTRGLPLVLKPRRGADGRDIRLLTDAGQARRALSRQDWVLQQFLGPGDATGRYLAEVQQAGIPLFHTFEGVKRSLQVLIGPAGDVRAACCTQHTTTGRNARTVTPDADPAARDIAERCARVLAAQGWRGPMNIQCQPDAAGRLLIHEFNARFTGATAARRLLGHDEVGMALEAFLACPLPAAPAGGGAAMAWESLAPRAAAPADAARLADQGRWQRTP